MRRNSLWKWYVFLAVVKCDRTNTHCLLQVQRRLSKRKDISFSKTRHIVSYDRASDIASESDFGGSASGTGPRRVHSLPAPIRTHLNENDGSGEDGTMDRVLRPLSTEVPRLSLALPKPREKVYKLAPVPAVNLQDLSPDLSKLDLTRSEDFIVAMDNSIEYEHQQQGEVEDRNRSSTTLKSQVSSAKGSILSSEFPFRDSQSGQVDRSNLWTWFCTSQREYDLTNFTRSKVVSSDMLLVIRANAFLYAVLILSLVCIEFPYKQLLVRFDFLFWVGLVAYLFVSSFL